MAENKVDSAVKLAVTLYIIELIVLFNTFVSFGVFMMMVSDGLLAWNMYVSSIRHGDTYVIITYWLALIFMFKS